MAQLGKRERAQTSKVNEDKESCAQFCCELVVPKPWKRVPENACPWGPLPAGVYTVRLLFVLRHPSPASAFGLSQEGLAGAQQGGKEASRSNALLHSIIADAIEETVPEVGRGLISLVRSREDIDALLALNDVIDLVTPVKTPVFCACPPPTPPQPGFLPCPARVRTHKRTHSCA